MQQDKPRSRGWWALLLFALAVRLTFVGATSDSLTADPDGYRRLAENLRQHGVFGNGHVPTAFRPPLYPWLLAAVATHGSVSMAAAALTHVLLGTATVMLTHALGSEWGLGRWALLAGGLVAVDPILLNQSTLIMTETLATFLATATLLALARMRAPPRLWIAALAGGLAGLAALCRPTFLPWLALVAVVLVWQRHDAGARWRQAAAFCLAASLMLSPWVVRNWLVFGVPKVSTTHGGYTVLLGNNPGFYRYLRAHVRGTVWDATELAQLWELRGASYTPDDELWNWPPKADRDWTWSQNNVVRTELEDDAFAYALARRYIREEPLMFARACVFRIGSLWQLTPHATSETESTLRRWLRWLVGAWYAALFLLAAVGAFRETKRLFRPPMVWGLLLCLTFTATHAIYWSNMRMRAPLMPCICLLAAAGAAGFCRAFQVRKP